MELNYSNHRLENHTELEKYKKELGDSLFWSFLNTVYGWLSDMKIGDSIDITTNSRITTKNRDLFIKAVCLFISEGNDDFKFSEDFTSVIRFDIAAEITYIKKFYSDLEDKRLKHQALCSDQINE